MKVWKAVQVVGPKQDRKVSLFWNDEINCSAVRAFSGVEYKEGEWVEAGEASRQHGYGLLAFDSLKAARTMLKRWGLSSPWNPGEPLRVMVELWEAEAEGEIELTTHPRLDLGYHHDDMHWPEGTIMVRRIKLVKLVKGVYDESR
jgi:hypothetical protein